MQTCMLAGVKLQLMETDMMNKSKVVSTSFKILQLL